jgi:hypothetical protein
MGRIMKAYIAHTGDLEDGCLLVFAKTPGMAKQLFLGAWPGRDYLEWNWLRVNRRPAFDKWAQPERGAYAIIDNSELPAGAPPFYDDEYYDDK